MKKLIKWGGIAVGVCLVLIVGAVVLVPMFVDVQKYKPEIEALVTEQTGRSFSMGDDIKLSVFPWVGVSLSDLKLGNAAGFAGGEMVSVKGFEVRLKVMPLFSRQVQVDKFIMDSPRILLVKNKAGKVNWELGPAAKKKKEAKPASAPAEKSGGLPINSLMVGRFSITNGWLSYVDETTGMKKEVSDLNLALADISLDKPVKIDFSARLDGKPLSLSGQAGPVGREPGKSDLGIDLVVKALDQLEMAVKGQLIAPMTEQKIDLALNVAPFSPRKLFEALGQPFPVETADPGVLDKVFFKAAIKGSASAVALTGGEMGLDDSLLKFSAAAKAFDKPDIKFDLALDKIDVDRYLPPAKEGQGEKTAGGAGARTGKPASQAKPDYGPLRKMVLDGKATVGSLKAAKLKMENVLVKVTGKGGVFNLDPFSMDFYQGKAGATARVDLRQNTPMISLNLTSKAVQAGPAIKDAVQKEIIEGAMNADIGLTMTGDTPEQIKQSLGGKGELTFTDGAIIGFDIAGTIRSAKSGLGLAEKPAEKPKTDFAELKIPYTAKQGLVNISGASLVSPLLRLVTTGNTHLAKESLDFRIEPKVVATLKGQGDTEARKGLLIPLLVTGSYSDPKVRPDLEGVMKKQLTDPEGILKVLGSKSDTGTDSGTGTQAGTEKVKAEDAAKKLLKSFIQ